MAKLKTMVSAVGSLKGLDNATALEFDDLSRTMPDEELSLLQTFAKRPLKHDLCCCGSPTPAEAQQTTSDSQGDTFAIVHIPADNDFAAVLVLNPSTLIESGQSFSTIADEGGWPVIVAMVEEFLGLRVDHVAELGNRRAWANSSMKAWAHCPSTAAPRSAQEAANSWRAPTNSTA